MKLLTSLLFLLLSIQGFNQIVIRGVKNAEIIETNKDKNQVTEIKEINFTKTDEEKVQPIYVTKNNISNATIETKQEKVLLDINGNEAIKTGIKNVVIIDLEKAKQQIDSIQNNVEKTETLVITEPKVSNTTKLEPEKTEIVAKNKTTSISETDIPAKEKTTEPIVETKKTISTSNNEAGIFIEPKTKIVENKPKEIETKALAPIETATPKLVETKTPTPEKIIETPKTSIVAETKEVNTKQNEEKVQPIYVTKNNISNATVEIKQEKVLLQINGNDAIKTGSKNIVIIDLEKAKQQIDSIQKNVEKNETLVITEPKVSNTPKLEPEKTEIVAKNKTTSISETDIPVKEKTAVPIVETKKTISTSNNDAGIFIEPKSKIVENKPKEIETKTLAPIETTTPKLVETKTPTPEKIIETPKTSIVAETEEVNFTKTNIEKVQPIYVTKNNISNATVEIKQEKVLLQINGNDAIKTGSKNIVIIDLEKAKQQIDSIRNKVEKTETLAPIETTTPKLVETKTSTPEKIIETPKTSIVAETKEIYTKQNEESGIFFESKKAAVPENVINEVKTIEKPIVEKKEEEPIVVEIKKPVGNLNNLENIKLAEPNIKTNVSETSKPIGNLNNLETIASKTETSETNENKGNQKNGSWSASLKFGVPVIIGDVNSKAGYGASFSVQKAIGHIFSLRFEALALETYGLSTNKINNVYANYKTRFSDYTLQGVFTLNNLNFYKKEPKVLYNIAIGGGLATRYTWTNSRDENGNLYNYDNLNTENRKETLKSLNALLDKKYETSIPKNGEKMSIKNTNILPTLVLGLGVDIKLSEKFDLNLSSRISNHFDDNLDGLVNGKNSDWMSFTSLGITYKFGSKNKSLLWTNPIYSKTEELEELKKKVKDGDLLKDVDKDGIADIFDQDLNTPEKVAVDSRGIPSDMDKDGVPDYKDAQPFTPIGAKVNEKGIAIDADNDGVADILDLENNTTSGNQVDASGRTILAANVSGTKNKNNLAEIAENSDFDLIFFDENSVIVKKEFYSTLYKITKYLQANPNSEIQITGHTDVLNTEKYNLNLSEKRTNAVYSMLVQMFKVSPNNLRTNFEGETKPIIEGLSEQKDINMEAAYYINRRVEFKILK